jgi:hypothetical protein
VPPSRPIPDCRAPPNGARRSRTKKQLTHTVPATSWAQIRLARARSPVNTVAASPYRVLLASAIASASSAKVCTVSTGPNTSSVRISAPGAASASSVGW